ncbi:condensation domain-containing protein, partial [Crocosphaera chwakensis]
QNVFQLAKDNLFSVTLLQLESELYWLFFNIHHIIFDGWSYEILQRELFTLYQAYSQEKSSPLSSLPIQYADFSLWQHRCLTAKNLASQVNYWKEQLGETLPILELPTDRPRPKIQTYKGATKTFTLSSELTASIKAFSQREGVTIFMTLLAAFKVLLGRYSGQKDIIVGTAIAGRRHKEIENLIGFFVNTLALRSQLSNHFSLRELLTQTKQICLDAYANQDVQFEKLVEILQPERDLSYSPIFQVMFVLQNTEMNELKLPKLTVTNLETSRQTAKFDMTLSIEESQEELIGEWEYNRDLFDSMTIERMIKHYQVLISALLTNSQENIWKVPLLTEREKKQLLVEWNQTQTNYPKINQLIDYLKT